VHRILLLPCILSTRYVCTLFFLPSTRQLSDLSGSFSPEIRASFEHAIQLCRQLWFEPFDRRFPLDDPETALKNESLILIYLALTSLYVNQLQVRPFTTPPPLYFDEPATLTTAATHASEIFFLAEAIGLRAISLRINEYSVPTFIGNSLLCMSFLQSLGLTTSTSNHGLVYLYLSLRHHHGCRLQLTK